MSVPASRAHSEVFHASASQYGAPVIVPAPPPPPRYAINYFLLPNFIIHIVGLACLVALWYYLRLVRFVGVRARARIRHFTFRQLLADLRPFFPITIASSIAAIFIFISQIFGLKVYKRKFCTKIFLLLDILFIDFEVYVSDTLLYIVGFLLPPFVVSKLFQSPSRVSSERREFCRCSSVKFAFGFSQRSREKRSLQLAVCQNSKYFASAKLMLVKLSNDFK